LSRNDVLLEKVFNSIDKDGSGTLTTDEFKTVTVVVSESNSCGVRE
jgi:Ca2+-binding EF-hand superfamily protein